MSKAARARNLVRITRDIRAILNMIAVLEADGECVPARAIAAIQVLQRDRYQYFTRRQKLVWHWLALRLRVQMRFQ